MSAETQNTPSSPCDALLDYAYGELEGAAKEAFERHLAECEKCKRELEALGKVRSATRAALPLLDPPATATGALHAQLLHAAAQRKPPARGKLLSFPRRMMQHPGMLAAATLLVIGGALGLNWSKGHLFLPAPEMRTPAEAAKPVEAPPVAATVPAATPAPPAATGAKGILWDDATDTGTTIAKDKSGAPAAHVTTKAADEKLMLDMPQKPMKVRLAAPKEPAPEFKATQPKNGYASDLELRQPGDSSLGAVGGGRGAKKEAAPARNRVSGNAEGQGDVMNYAIDGKTTEKTVAPAAPPPPVAKPQVQTATPSMDNSKQQQSAPREQFQYRSSMPSAGAAAPAPAVAEEAAAPEPQAVQQQTEAPAPAKRKHGKKSAPSTTTRDDNNNNNNEADARKAFDDAASNNNCSEVISRYAELSRTKQKWATPDEEAAFSRCISQARREQQTQDNAEKLRSKAKKAKPAAADAPAQAAPASPTSKSNAY